MLYFQLCLKTFPPLFNDNSQVPSGGAREKVAQVLLRRKVMLCYDTNRFLNQVLCSLKCLDSKISILWKKNREK